jgi:hypothetical protein
LALTAAAGTAAEDASAAGTAAEDASAAGTAAEDASAAGSAAVNDDCAGLSHGQNIIAESSVTAISFKVNTSPVIVNADSNSV